MYRRYKRVKPFFFKNKSHEEVANFIDKIMPISLVYNKDLIERIHARYPIRSKAEIAYVVKGVFQAMRHLLILGKVIHFMRYLINFRIYFHLTNQNGYYYSILKLKSKINKRWRYYGIPTELQPYFYRIRNELTEGRFWR